MSGVIRPAWWDQLPDVDNPHAAARCWYRLASGVENEAIRLFVAEKGAPGSHARPHPTTREDRTRPARPSLPTPERNAPRGGVCGLLLAAVLLSVLWWIGVGYGIAIWAGR